jgi:hypothetical protein
VALGGAAQNALDEVEDGAAAGGNDEEIAPGQDYLR